MSLEEARTKIDTTDKSYNELSATMRELKKAFKSATDETAKADISANVDKINGIGSKELDASNGVYSKCRKLCGRNERGYGFLWR